MYNLETSPTPTPISFDTEAPIDSATQNGPALVRRGAREGATMATKAAFVYAVFLGFSAPLWSGVPELFTIQSALFSILVAFIIGVVPAQIVGAVGGAILGVVFQQLRTQTILPVALVLGTICGALILLPLTLVAAFLLFKGNMSPDILFSFGLIWGFPALSALFGCAWVGQRLNLLLPLENTNE